MKKTLFFLVALWVGTLAIGQTGSLDPSYGDNGIKAVGDPIVLTDYIRFKNLPADDGGQYAIYSQNLGIKTSLVIVKYLKNGTIDVSYGSSGFSEVVPIGYGSAVRQADGRITVAGKTESSFGDVYFDAMVVRFDSNGTIDKTLRFDSPFPSAFESVGPIHLQDDKVIMPVFSQSDSKAIAFYAMILYPDGSLWEKMYGPYEYKERYFVIGNDVYIYEGVFDSRWEFSLQIALEGEKVVVEGLLDYTGELSSQDGLTIHNFFFTPFASRYNADGTLDYSFGVEGRYPAQNYSFPSFPSDAYVVPAPDLRKVVLSSVANPVSGNQDFHITVYREDGSLDLGFGGTGSVQVDFGGEDVPTAYLWQEDKLIVGGNTADPQTGRKSFALVRLHANGTLDRGFDGDGRQTTYREGYTFDLERLTIQPAGEGQRLLAVGTDVIAAYILGKDVVVEVTLSCPASKVVPTGAGVCSAVVTGIDPVLIPAGSTAVVNYTISGATTGSGTGNVSGKVFIKGVTTVTYTLAENPAQNCSFTVTVEDKEAPVISNVWASVTSLWPPNHKLVDVQINYTLNDNCGATAVLSVSSNEPQTSADPDDKAPDWVVMGAHRVQLRAERQGNGNGRIYTITIAATDAAGNQVQKQVMITVPKSRGKNASPLVAGKDLQHVTAELDNDLQARVLPNPSSTQFTLLISSKSDEAVHIRVLDAQGKLIEVRKNHPVGSLQFGNNYRPGVYYLEVVQQTEKVLVKLVKVG